MAKLILPEQDSEIAELLFTEISQLQGLCLAVDFAFIEVTNIIWKQVHRKLLPELQAREKLQEMFELPISWNAGQTELTRVLELAMKYDMAVYDALFVANAELLKIPAVTSDLALFKRVHGDFPNIQMLDKATIRSA